MYWRLFEPLCVYLGDEKLKQKRWTRGKGAVRAIKDVALAQGKCIIVINRGGTFRLLV
ncbi:hypothetical protein Plhal304r1_c031g0101411 [Plasmopara halstedii]